MAGLWEERAEELAARLGVDPEVTRPLASECLRALRAWARTGSDQAAGGSEGLTAWLVGLRQEFSLEGLARALMQLDHAFRDAAWLLGLPGPDWKALSDVLARFFEAGLDLTVEGARGRHVQSTRLREELALLRRLAAALDGPDGPGALMAVAVRETAHLLNCEFCAVLLPAEDDPRVLKVAAAEAPPLLRSAVSSLVFPLDGPGIVSQVVMSGAPASSSNPLADLDITLRRRQTLEGLGFGHLMAHPLTSGGRVVGVLVLANRLDDEPWSAIDDDWLSAIASHLAMAIVLTRSQSQLLAQEAEAVRWLETVLALADPALRRHGEAVGQLAGQLAVALGLGASRVRHVVDAGRVHDVGQVFWPEVLRRRPGPLWPEETPHVLEHPERGAVLLDGVRVLAHLAPTVRAHHERWDGGGYPQGLAGDHIPLEARILAVADAYETMTTAQVYRAALPPRMALQAIRDAAGSQFDPLIVQTLVEVLGATDLEPMWLGTSEGKRLEAEGPGLPSLASRLIAAIHRIASRLDGDALPRSFWTAVREQCGFDAALLWRRGDGGGLVLVEALGLVGAPLGATAGPGSVEVHAATCQVPVSLPSIGEDARFQAPTWLDTLAAGSAAAFPMIANDRALGVLTLLRRAGLPYTGAELAVAEVAAALAAQGLRPHTGHTGDHPEEVAR
ncbi:MAG: HD domain-containing phosphohydrolase [Candidatus Sericytochromatia bacterium]|nr:HD domain-containing phosphohydrolase [Candidatus Sericytochromatia bacterium]